MAHQWNLDQVPDLSERVMIITGANSGIGYEAALALAKRKADVVLACRNQDKAKAAADRIRERAIATTSAILATRQPNRDARKSFFPHASRV